MSTAEVIDGDGCQTVKLPAEIHIVGKVVSVRREGNQVILEPVATTEAPRDADVVYIGAGAFLADNVSYSLVLFSTSAHDDEH